jgi:GTP-binding protein LepA
MDTGKIRNFCIIAHIDHGKSTLADRLLELTGTLSVREMKTQVLDSMDLERERGITIKSHAIRMDYTASDGEKYILNLIDTPGHVDFTYEVSRSLMACEGAILIVDASQGIEAQTLSNLFMALDAELQVIPVINKIDLPSAEVARIAEDISNLLGVEENEILKISAKTGAGVEQVLEAVVKMVPPPKGDPRKPARALIFDSAFDSYRGAVAYVRVFDGSIKKGDWIKFFAHNRRYEVDEIGFLKLKMNPRDMLSAGEVGYVIANIRNVGDTRVGDTITVRSNPAVEPLPGFRKAKPMVFAGLYPSSSEDFEELRVAIEKLKLNDSAIFYEPETSNALGFGFRVGFLGLLHMEIVQERLQREYELSIINTVPNVEYRVNMTDDKQILIENPSLMPEPGRIVSVEEPFVDATVITPSEYIGNLMKLCQDRRGIYKTTSYIDSNRASLRYEIPLSMLRWITNFWIIKNQNSPSLILS